MKKQFSLTIYYFTIIMYLEICHKYFVFQNIFDIGLLYTALFTLFFSLILTFFSRLSTPKINKRITLTIVFILSLIYGGSYLYYNLFNVPFTFHVTSMAGQAMEFINVLLEIIIKNTFPLLILFLPFIISIIKKSKMIITKIYYYEKKHLIIQIICIYILSILILFPKKDQDYSAFKLYWKQDNLSQSIKTLGLFTAERLDLQRTLFGFEEQIENINLDKKEKEELTYNKMDINFDELIEQEQDETIKSAYSYFQNESATNQNEYTGIYKGKNIIFILAESFNSIAVSEELTPTLYKLTHSGFQFKNYYSPVFLSTTGGEFQAMTGLIPNAETLNEWYKGENSLPFAIGNAFQKLGYTTNAFHNYEATFYNRTNTMPTLGFQNYLACLNGLEDRMFCDWENDNAPDDQEMIKTTYEDYAKEEHFATYYITMSGHFPYKLSEYTRNYEQVKDLAYSDEVKAYLSTQIDLDKAIETLLENLKKDGILENTVICLVGDHYPYALSIDQINEISEYKRDEEFEIHHSNLIIWNSENKDVEIEKVSSQIDILPTLLNLFGIEYDSRLMIGHDIFSDHEGLAIFQDMSWISDSGSYNANTKTFTPNKEVSDTYVTQLNRWVNNSTIVSKKIISNDLYQKILQR